jgi:hypothetical protein
VFSKGIEFLCQSSDHKRRKKYSYSTIISNIFIVGYSVIEENISLYNALTDSDSPCSSGFALRILLNLILVWGYSVSLYQLLVLNVGVGKMQGWRTYLWARAQIVYKFQRNPFACHWEFSRVK